MRLRSLTVKNYRVHGEVSVDFDESRTLIGGANEVGKSTLVEAVHRGLFLRGKTGGEVQKSMVSSVHGGHPVVRLKFEVGGQEWTVEKCFKGATGTTKLEGGGKVLQGDEAEEKLANLLGVEKVDRASKTNLDTQWPHLWVWQGSSGKDPSKAAAEQRDALVQRLQKEGLGAVMQSDFDQRVRERIKSRYDESFTTKGESKAGSVLDLAEKRLGKAKESLVVAEQAMKRLEDAVVTHLQAVERKRVAERELPKLQQDLQEVMRKIGEVQSLQQKMEPLEGELLEADRKLKDLREEQRQYAELKEQFGTLEAELVPLEESVVSYAAEVEVVEVGLGKLDAGVRAAVEQVQKARGREEVARVLVQVFEKGERVEELRQRWVNVQEVKVGLEKVRKELNGLPGLSSQDLDRVRKLERELMQAEAARDATAAELRLLEVVAGVEVRVNGELLERGVALGVTEEVEIVIGDGTKLKLRPGGGGGLAEVRSKVEVAQEGLQKELRKMGVRDLQQAAEVVMQVERLQRDEKLWVDKLKFAGGEKVEVEKQAAQDEWQRAKAELERGVGLVEEQMNLPETLQAARDWLNECQQVRAGDERDEMEKKGRQEEQRQRVQRAKERLQMAEKQVNERKLSLIELKGKLQVLGSRYADDSQREEVLREAQVRVRDARVRLEEAQGQLRELQPEMLASEEQRVKRSMQKLDDSLRQAEDVMAEARGQLRFDGHVDPQVELQKARARVDAEEEVVRLEKRHGEAIKSLQKLFQQSSKQINAQIVEPLAEKVTEYLQRVFGLGARLQVTLSDKGEMGLELVRQSGSCGFESLSGGAKEQVAAAVRLAMAEILAEEHGGCLPVVFDDAFAYADPQRVQELQRMLDLAAERGLQVVVLTCNPADYVGFGAEAVAIGA